MPFVVADLLYICVINSTGDIFKVIEGVMSGPLMFQAGQLKHRNVGLPMCTCCIS